MTAKYFAAFLALTGASSAVAQPFTASLWSTAMGDSGGPYQPQQYKSIRFADVNGDGVADLCYRGSPATGGINCALALNGSFGPATSWTSAFDSSWSSNEYYWGTIQYADVNGDGRADVCGRGPGGVYCALSNGSSFGPLTLWSPAFSDANSWNSDPSFWKTIRFADVNGDGKQDVCGRGTLGIYCALSNGSSFGPAALWSSQYSNSNNWQSDPSYWSTIQFADLNGDGKADVCGRGGAGMICAVSNGSQFVNLAVWTTQFNDSYGWRAPQYYSTIQLADIDGDGKADVCGRGGSGVYCGRSTGGAFGSDVFTVGAASFSDANGWAAAEYYATLQVVDADGDGRADVCGRGYLGIWCQLSASTNGQTVFAPAVLWVNNFGDNNGWGASESYWGTVQPARVAESPSPRHPPRGFCGRGYGGILCSNTVLAQADAAYDQTPSAQASFDSRFGAWASTLVLHPASGGITVVIPPDEVDGFEDAMGFTGSYDGGIYTSSILPTPAYLTLKNYQGEAHGTLTILGSGLQFDGGFFCGTVSVPAGATFPVNMTTTRSVPSLLTVRSQFDASGSTTRQVSILGLFSGQVVTSFTVSLMNAVSNSYLTGSIHIQAPSPCQSQQANISFTRRNQTLLQAFGY